MSPFPCPHQSGLSIRQIASATGLSSSRVHRPLGSDEARETPRWLSQQRGRDHSDHIRAGLNEPRPNLLVETFRPSSPDCAFCVERRTRLLRGGIRVKRSDSKLWDCGMRRTPRGVRVVWRHKASASGSTLPIGAACSRTSRDPRTPRRLPGGTVSLTDVKLQGPCATEEEPL